MQVDTKILKLSWSRLKQDCKYRGFIKNPLELKIVCKDYEIWIAEIKRKLKKNIYVPGTNRIIDVPKQNGAIRPGSFLRLSDLMIYNYLVGKYLKNIKKSLSWSSGSVVFSHLIATTNSAKWLYNPFNSWSSFRNESIKILSEGYSYVLFTDITAFYENINIKILISDLLDLGCSGHEKNLLSQCLNKWSSYGIGIPQGFASSDILSNVYLDDIDRKFTDLGYKFVRYGDDYRVFCKDKTETKKAQQDLIKLLRLRGLNLQNEKTKINRSKESIVEIEGESQIIKSVKEQLAFSNVEETYSNDYFVGDVFDSKNYDELNGAAFVRDIFDAYFIDNSTNFDKTLFRFCLQLFARAKDDHALSTCLSFLKIYPEQTEYILKYLTSIKLDENHFDHILKYFSSKDAIYNYQKYQIVDWINNNFDLNIKQFFLKEVKKIISDSNAPCYLRTVSRLLVSEIGHSSDLDTLCNLFSDDMPVLEKCELILCLSRMEKTKRNSFLGNVKNDSFLISASIKMAKNIDN